ncbi:S1C family serine protease [Jannaschia aquimarina]|uniref:MucD protein n=1 Tax=Jannaschia aquimarina TaxID=935700 RepID=A0A0D1EID1_9RHOB|nr:trypsin-like peptidase domain-containing protein [Jannaschia aquimarina]KIT17354.1 putative periplasmic serine endoprotease DegP-like precursor [Jannaschia aquimarina]SNT20801.1 DegP2 peptidase. Serine peptidase. MEROPS family S01B [Jannaschia aquimarina]
MRSLPLLLILAIGVVLGAFATPRLQTLLAPAPTPVTVTPRGDLASDERATIELFEAAQGSVVSIATTVQRRSLFSRGVEVPRGSGSGFVWGDGGHVVTNAHVIAGATGATVRLPGGRALRARLVGVAPRHDLAVLQVDGIRRMRALPLGTSGDLQVGQKVFAIGNPFGLDFTLTTGIVSALDRELPGEGGMLIRGLIQTDAAINPGNSGGPLLDSAGRLIGVNTAIYSPSGASAGIGFAVPSDTVARVVPQLIERGRYAPPTLGITADARIDAMLRANGQGPGVMVLDVEGPAADAGLRPARITDGGIIPGDVIEAIDGARVETVEGLLAELDARTAGQEVTLTLRGPDGVREVTLPLAPGL